MTALLRAVSLTALLVLSACGSERGIVNLDLLSQIPELLRRTPEAPSLRERLTPETLATIDGPILLIELPERGAEAGAQIVRTGGGHVVWSTLDQIQFSFKSGVLTSTRGLGGDLMSADIDQVVSALRNGRRESVRVHRYLDGEDQMIARAYVCSYTRSGGQRITTLTGAFQTRLVTESCTSSDHSFENQYWIDGRGTVRKSKQWVGIFPEYALTELIND